MLNSSHLCGMPAESKRAALMMALDAGGAKVEDILQDAIVRQRVLHDYEEARQRDLQNFDAATQEQNRAIQAEMDRVTGQYMARMQSHLDEVARAQDNFRVWQKRKLQEAQRIADAADCAGSRHAGIGRTDGSAGTCVERGGALRGKRRCGWLALAEWGCLPGCGGPSASRGPWEAANCKDCSAPRKPCTVSSSSLSTN